MKTYNTFLINLEEGLFTQNNIFTDPDITGKYNDAGFTLASKGIIHNFGTNLDRFSMRNILSATHNESLARNQLKNNNDFEGNKLINRYTRESHKLNSKLYNYGVSGKKVPELLPLNPAYESFFTGDKEHFNVDKLDKMMYNNPLPHPITVYTGYHGDPNAKNGKNIILHAYTSTSLTPNIAKEFGKEFGKKPITKHVFRLNLPKGFPHVHTVLNSLFPEEDEVLLPRGLRVSLPNNPTHTISGSFRHYSDEPKPTALQIHLWDATIHNQF